ncbi:two-component system response regulator [Streptomyces sp. NBC_00083]|uniref:response regulator n=1 Tax=Streptomyces sp. NBC_00083 TaxID=2975647 RepID=UPI00224E8BEB|nr:response regulator [Streptomyces sp. NBC_00083]MCX5387707.1 response regulator [Streptomyces sp. NBC_00083]
MSADMKVLLVDDHEDNLFAMESILAPLGYPLELVTSGDAALKAALHGGIAVAVLDVVMPGVSGLDVARYLSRLTQTQLIPVILVTGMGHDGATADEALRLGVADYLIKPLDPWALRIKVKYLYRASALLAAAPPHQRGPRNHPADSAQLPPRRRQLRPSDTVRVSGRPEDTQS